MNVLSCVKVAGAATLQYLGDAAHRRFVSATVALALTQIIGHAIAGQDVANALDIVVGGLAGAWSRNTPKIVVPAESGE